MINSLKRWFWSNPWTQKQESTEVLMRRLGILRLLICFGAMIVFFIQGKHVLLINLSGPKFYYYDRSIWYFSILQITHTFPILDLLNFYLGLFCLFLAAIGFNFRTNIFIALIAIFFLHGTRSAYNGSNHHVMIPWVHALFILLFSKAGMIFSIKEDKYTSFKPWEGIWPVRVIQIMLILFYFSAAIAKYRTTGLGWLSSGSAVQRILLTKWQSNLSSTNLGKMIAFNPTLCWFLSIALVALQFITPILLLKPKYLTKLLVFSLALFHLLTRYFTGVPFQFNAILLLVFLDHLEICENAMNYLVQKTKGRLSFIRKFRHYLS